MGEARPCSHVVIMTGGQIDPDTIPNIPTTHESDRPSPSYPSKRRPASKGDISRSLDAPMPPVLTWGRVHIEVAWDSGYSLAVVMV